eukprot:5559483-Pyramimonas_sp.AAC.1
MSASRRCLKNRSPGWLESSGLLSIGGVVWVLSTIALSVIVFRIRIRCFRLVRLLAGLGVFRNSNPSDGD